MAQQYHCRGVHGVLQRNTQLIILKTASLGLLYFPPLRRFCPLVLTALRRLPVFFSHGFAKI